MTLVQTYGHDRLITEPTTKPTADRTDTLHYANPQSANDEFQTLTISSMASMSGKNPRHGIVTMRVWYTVST